MKYLTLAGSGSATVVEKRSRFIAQALPVDDERQARDQVARIANQYHDARHVCWAFVAGADGSRQLSSDNGEPSGTAGRPILGQITTRGLTNTLVAVVRYFGGIKLGTPGLAAAYRQAASDALDAAGTAERQQMATLTLTYPYLAMNDVMRVVKDLGVSIVEQDFDNECRLTVMLPADDESAMRERLGTIARIENAGGGQKE